MVSVPWTARNAFVRPSSSSIFYVSN